MLKQIFKFKILIILIFSLLILTGCTPYNISYKNTSKKATSVPENSITTLNATLKVTDQEGKETIIEIPFSEGENLYEILNSAMISNDNLKIEFDSYIFNNGEEYLVRSINGYDPEVDHKIWNLQINGKDSTFGILNTFPKEGDFISYSLKDLPE